ncbi:nuclear transport factor 2 family protein, partial [Kitasatospora sp. RB6PN24]|uniref:nuclear transport factor 2 family protein n=1 Tax=Kitasatospora humi TaxID=2893891 RepID=UPI001E31DB5F
MTESQQTAQTRAVAERWFTALFTGDFPTALDCLAEDVEFINYAPVPGYNDDMAWIGTYHGRQAVLDSLGVFTSVAQVDKEELVRISVDGEFAAGVVHERSTIKATGLPFEIEFVQWLTVRDGKIVRWKSYTDPSQIIRAIRGDDDPRSRHHSAALLDAVRRRDTAAAATLLTRGADANTRDADSGLTALMIAAGQADPETVELLLA